MVSSYAGNTEWDRARAKAFELVQNQFGSLPLNCQDLDRNLKRLQDAIINAYKIPIAFTDQANENLYQRAYKEQLELKKHAWESMFETHGCRDIIENIRLQSGAVKETQFAIKSEQQVLGSVDKNQNTYLIAGGAVLLIGLFIILQK